LHISYISGINPVSFYAVEEFLVRTRIRHFRKQRGLTQTELAARLGTTAATVSRLETADMTVSTGWLERIAGELDVPVTDLLGAQGEHSPACMGEVLRGGGVAAFAEPPSLPPSLFSHARAPMVFQVGEALGPYMRGDLLVADCLPVAQAAVALGRDCFAASEKDDLFFGRLVTLGMDGCLLLPPEDGAHPCNVSAPRWVAPVVTLLRNYPPLKT
jgi:transcriptional regulator with XRE-family HTH domain